MISKLVLSAAELLRLNPLMVLACFGAGAGGVTAELVGFRPSYDSFASMVVLGGCAALMSVPRLIWSQSRIVWSEGTKQAERSLVATAGLLYVIVCAIPIAVFVLASWSLPPAWIQLTIMVLGIVAGVGAFAWFRARNSW